MDKKKQPIKFKRILDETINIPEKSGNGILKLLMSVDKMGRLGRYSFAYINPRLCNVDNGRVLGYDNSHGYHHRHYFGKEEPVEFESYEAVAEQFDFEWRTLHEQSKKNYH